MLRCRNWPHKCSVVTCRVSSHDVLDTLCWSGPVIRAVCGSALYRWNDKEEWDHGQFKHLIGIPPGCQSVICDHYFDLEVVEISSPKMMQIFSQPVLHTYTTLSMKLTRSKPHFLIHGKTWQTTLFHSLWLPFWWPQTHWWRFCQRIDFRCCIWSTSCWHLTADVQWWY